MKEHFTYLFFFILIITSCQNHQKTENNHSAESISLDSQAISFWKNMDMSKIDFTDSDKQMEHLFIEYLAVLSQSNENTSKISINNLLSSAEKTSNLSFLFFINLFEKYLYNPNSPIRNESMYSSVLKYLVYSSNLDSIDKAGYMNKLTSLSMNVVGEIATDFDYISRGRRSRLSQIKSDYIILFFNDPECQDCVRVKRILSEFNAPNVKIVSIFTTSRLVVWQNTIYPEAWINGYNYTTIHKLYDLKAMPTLYLLDKNKRVILKDADVETIIDFFDGIR